jgi:hypothetical protein
MRGELRVGSNARRVGWEMNTEFGLHKSGFFPSAHIDLSGCKEKER